LVTLGAHLGFELPTAGARPPLLAGAVTASLVELCDGTEGAGD
jgi:hypothetical protein